MMAVASGGESLSIVSYLWENVRKHADEIRVPEFAVPRAGIAKAKDTLPAPWQRAESAAALARKTWSIPPYDPGMNDSMVQNKDLEDQNGIGSR